MSIDICSANRLSGTLGSYATRWPIYDALVLCGMRARGRPTLGEHYASVPLKPTNDAEGRRVLRTSRFDMWARTNVTRHTDVQLKHRSMRYGLNSSQVTTGDSPHIFPHLHTTPQVDFYGVWRIHDQ